MRASTRHSMKVLRYCGRPPTPTHPLLPLFPRPPPPAPRPLPVEAVDHLELRAEVLLAQVIEHACVHQTLHEGAAVLRQAEPRQPLVADPLVVHLAKRQRLQRAAPAYQPPQPTRSNGRFFSRAANLSSGMNDIHATRQVCRPAEKMAGKKTTRHKILLLTFMQTRDMYLHFTRSNVWANGNRYNFSSRVKTR